MRLILDTNILISRPEILSHGGDSVRFLLPQTVYQELSASRFADRAGDLLERASRAGRLHVIPTPTEGVTDFPLSKQIGYTDTLILITALDYQNRHKGQQVFLVTDDRMLAVQANKLGLKTATSKTIDELIHSAPAGLTVSKELSDAAASLVDSNRNYLIRGFALGLVVAALLFTAWHFRHLLGQTFPIWGLTFGAAILGLALFWFRSRYRLSYGVVEGLFGLFTASRLANPSTYDFTFLLQLAAGLYIIVRGLDNIEKGIEGTKLEPMWKRIFRRNSNA